MWILNLLLVPLPFPYTQHTHHLTPYYEQPTNQPKKYIYLKNTRKEVVTSIQPLLFFFPFPSFLFRSAATAIPFSFFCSIDCLLFLFSFAFLMLAFFLFAYCITHITFVFPIQPNPTYIFLTVAFFYSTCPF